MLNTKYAREGDFKLLSNLKPQTFILYYSRFTTNQTSVSVYVHKKRSKS